MNSKLKAFALRIYHLQLSEEQVKNEFELVKKTGGPKEKKSAKEKEKLIKDEYGDLHTFFLKCHDQLVKDIDVFNAHFGNFMHYFFYGYFDIIKFDEFLHHRLSYNEEKHGSMDSFLKQFYDKDTYNALYRLIHS